VRPPDRGRADESAGPGAVVLTNDLEVAGVNVQAQPVRGAGGDRALIDGAVRERVPSLSPAIDVQSRLRGRGGVPVRQRIFTVHDYDRNGHSAMAVVQANDNGAG
jgi:hypothetical protein